MVIFHLSIDLSFGTPAASQFSTYLAGGPEVDEYRHALLVDQNVAWIEVVVSPTERVQVVNGRREGLHERFLVHGPRLILNVVG